MNRYEVVRPWHGVSLGQVVLLKEVHPSLKSHVRLLKGDVAKLTPATPNASGDESVQLVRNKANVAKRLKELDIAFDGKLSLDELAALLPEGEPLKG